MADTSLQRHKRRGGAGWDGVGREQSEKIKMDNLEFYLICRIKESLVNNNGKEANPKMAFNRTTGRSVNL